MTPETVDSLKEALTPLMEKLGATGEYAWQLAIRQQYVKAISQSVWPVLLLLAALAAPRLYRVWKCWYAASDGNYQREDRRIWGYVMACISVAVLVGLTVATVIGVTVAIGRLINPEWYALEMLIKTITGAGQ